MANRIDIYGMDRKIEYYKKRIADDPTVTAENKKALFEFFNYCFSTGLSKTRVFILAHKLYYLAKWLGKDFKEATKEDLQHLFAEIEQNTKYSAWTKHFFKTCLKKFYKWSEGNGEEFPEKIRWLKTNMKNCSNKLPEELLTQEEVRRMIDAALNPRDKALLALLWESGARIGEIAGLQIKHISFNEHGASAVLYGKTGSRRVLLIFAYPFILNWLENHPFKTNPEAPMWCALTREKRGQALFYNELRLQIVKTAQRAGVAKKVNPHSFRHSRATQLAKLGLNEAQMSAYLGWVPDTDMAGVYLHLSGRDIDDAILKAYGLQTETKQDDKLPCFRCKANNIITSRFCQQCAAPLTVNAAISIDEKQSKLEEKLSMIMSLIENNDTRTQLAELVKTRIKKIN